MLFWLFVLFVLVPFTELTLLLMLARSTSVSTTLAIVILTGIAGSMLARSQGFRTYGRIRGELASGRMPTDSLVDAVMILVAGALLLTPGILTDIFGLSLLLPFCRRYYRFLAKQWFRSHFKVSMITPPEARAGGRSQVIDSYVVDSSDERSD